MRWGFAEVNVLELVWGVTLVTMLGLASALTASVIQLHAYPQLQTSPSQVYGAVGAAFGVIVGILWIAFGYFVVASIIAGGIIMAIANASPILSMFGVPIPGRLSEERGFSTIFSAVLAWAFTNVLLSYLFPTVYSALPPLAFITMVSTYQYSYLWVENTPYAIANYASALTAFGLDLVMVLLVLVKRTVTITI